MKTKFFLPFRRINRRLAALIMMLAGAAGSDNARAGSATWTGLGSDNTWTNASNWSPATVPNGANDVATFANNSPNWTNIYFGPASSSTITVSNIIFSAGCPGFTFSSGSTVYLLFAAAGGVTVSAGVTSDQDFTGVPLIRGASGTATAYTMANNGTGLLKLPVLTQYTGSGTIRVVFAGASGARISATVNDRGTQATSALLNAPVVLYLQDTGNNGNFNGGLTLRAGTVSVSSVALNSAGHSPLGTSNNLLIGSDDNTGQTSTLQFTGLAGTTDGHCSVTKGNTGVFDITNGSGNLILTTGIAEANSSSTTLPGNLTKIGLGTLTLNAKASFTGVATIANGTLALGAANALTTSAGVILGGSGTAGALDLGGLSQQVGALAVAGTAVAASQVISNSSTAGTGTLVFSNNAVNPSVFGGVLADGNKPVALTVLNGSLTLTNANTFSGNTLVSGGTLALGAGGTLANSGAINVNTNGTFNVAGTSFNLAVGQILCGYGVVTGNVTAANDFISPGTNGVAGTLTFTNGLTLNGGVTNHFDLALTPNTAGNDLIVAGGALNMSGLNTIEVNPLGTSLSAGTYSLIKFGSLGSGGAANFQVTGALGASLQGAVSVTASEVDLVVSQTGGTQRTWAGDGAANAWDYTTTNWLNGEVLATFSDGDFVTFDDTGSQTPAVNLTAALQPAAVLVNAAGNYTFAGAGGITGTATLTKTNAGTLTLLNTNNYSGITIIGQGTLQLGNGGTAGSVGTNIIQDSGALVLDLPGNNTFANTISGAGSLTQVGAGTLTLTASNNYSGGTTISAGTLQLNPGAWFGGGKITDNGALVFNGTGSVTVGAGISGTGAVTLNGSGTVALAGGNTYGGGTVVNHGTLLVNNATGSGTGAGAVTVAAGGTLGGAGAMGGPVTINSGGIFSPGNPNGVITISNNFTAANGAVLDFSLGAVSDEAVVSGNLTLNGTLNVTAGAGFTSATYPLFTYGGGLTLGAMTINLPPNTTATLATNTPGQVSLIVGTLQANIPSFPGALGFGANATGARFGGTVYHVTNLNDSGTGSFRDAVSQSGRFVVFDVGGYVVLNSAVSCANNLTIAGQTAPGGGIGIMGHEVSFSVKTNEIVRCVRFRPGSIASSTEDGLNMGDGTNLIFDHISIEFAPYNNVDATGNATDGNLITIQNSILADPIGQQFNAHTESLNNYFSWIYNILSSGHDRNPLAKVNTIFINNIVNNFQAGYTCADTSGNFSHDIINNYFITGPATTSAGDDFFQFDANQSVYAAGNLLDSANNGTLGGSATAPGGVTVLNAPWSALTPGIPTHPATTAYRSDVSFAGALPRDQVDQNVMGYVTSLGTAGQGAGLWKSQTTTGLGNSGYGVITNGALATDTDGDGMPDYWELAVGANPGVADSLTPGAGGYTKLENYLNWLGGPHAIAAKNSFVAVDLRQYTTGFTNDGPVYAVLAPTNGAVALQTDGHTAQFTATTNFAGLGGFNFSVRANDGSTVTNSVAVLVTATPETPPHITQVQTQSNTVTLSGTGGTIGGNYYLLGSTNLGAPLSQWTRLGTNQFDINGNFGVAFPAPGSAPQMFYLLQLP